VKKLRNSSSERRPESHVRAVVTHRGLNSVSPIGQLDSPPSLPNVSRPSSVTYTDRQSASTTQPQCPPSRKAAAASANSGSSGKGNDTSGSVLIINLVATTTPTRTGIASPRSPNGPTHRCGRPIAKTTNGPRRHCCVDGSGLEREAWVGESSQPCRVRFFRPVPVPTRCDLAGCALVPALRPFLSPRCGTPRRTRYRR
jgi:hypothetical protein